jgi:hypothetical protein
MTCQAAQELILEDLDCGIDAERQISLESHIAGCEMCWNFREAQQVLDATLATHCATPQLSATFSSDLAHKIRAEKRTHFRNGSRTARISVAESRPQRPVCCEAFFAGVVLTIGIALTVVSYVPRRCFVSGWRTWKGYDRHPIPFNFR